MMTEAEMREGLESRELVAVNRAHYEKLVAERRAYMDLESAARSKVEQLTARVAELEVSNAADREDFCTIVTQSRKDTLSAVTERNEARAANAVLRTALEEERKRCHICKGTGKRTIRDEFQRPYQEPCDLCGWIDTALSSEAVAAEEPA